MAQLQSLITKATPTSALLLTAGLLGLWVVFQLFSYLRDPLRDIPGPFWARFTRLWYLREIANGQFEKTNIALHRKYGPIVRISPHYYSIDDPEAIKTIYSHGSKFIKGNWYTSSANPSNKQADLFTDLNPERHALNRRNVASLYSMTSLVGMEPNVVDCAALLSQKFNDFAVNGTQFNLQVWFQYFAFDTIASITLSKRFGFLDTGADNGGMIAALHSYLQYLSKVGVIHEWHRTFMWILSFFPAGGMRYMGGFMMEQVQEGQRTKSKSDLEKDESKPTDDFLTKLLRMHALQPEKFPMDAVYSTCGTNIGAGSDTTSVSLAGIMYCLMKHPEAVRKLRQEIDQAVAERGSKEMLTFQEAQKLPYLQACIKEGLRCHPATGLPMVRVVPEGGATIAGRYFPAKTEVGVNSWVAHANQEVFGKDAGEFRPERWLESAERASEMNRYIMTFGAGSRTCIGKNISLLEISILIPELVRWFDITLADPKQPLETENVWFVKQKNLDCYVSLRQE
ncbi:cytochrome P450 oxidoreductase [Exophiala viscosa]|uniref:Cytochrome P450 oxidoreductase n=1 Tax=Exophiala viscosa TaxID=2486360 RepID=A0AAN6IAF3_9EURO|nr:cytochrome P450 oxidoreductase [Exophiala viscosa]